MPVFLASLGRTEHPREEFDNDRLNTGQARADNAQIHFEDGADPDGCSVPWSGVVSSQWILESVDGQLL